MTHHETILIFSLSRIVDVSTVKELGRRWNRDIVKPTPKKKLNHRAMDDIKESLEELKFYQKNLFVSPPKD